VDRGTGKKSGCDADTIRYYEREGLLEKPSRTASGYRGYATEHLGQLNSVRHCRSLGMTLAEIRTLQGFQANPNLACTDINILLDRHITRVHQQVKAMRRLEKQLIVLRDRCHDTLTASECSILNTLINVADGGDCASHRVVQDVKDYPQFSFSFAHDGLVPR
jgi:DNA-binding transcriptional MerR regulator